LDAQTAAKQHHGREPCIGGEPERAAAQLETERVTEAQLGAQHASDAVVVAELLSLVRREHERASALEVKRESNLRVGGRDVRQREKENK